MYQAIVYGIGLNQRKIFNYLLKRWYYECWIGCRNEMIAHGSSSDTVFSSKGVAAKNQKEARFLNVAALRCRVKILECFARVYFSCLSSGSDEDRSYKFHRRKGCS